MARAKFDHVAIATWSIRDALALFVDVLGARYVVGNDDDRQQIRTVQFALGPGVKIELMEPLADTSFLHAFLGKHGPGFHHATMLFADVEELIPEMEAAGFDVVNTNLADRAWRDTWARPSKAFGTLLQLADTDMDWMQRCEFTLEEVLDGKVIWNGNARVWRDGSRTDREERDMTDSPGAAFEGATFDHVAIAVKSLRDAVRLFADVLGAEYVAGGDDLRLDIRTVQFKLEPGVKIELMEPIGEDSYLARYIEKHGEGFHHTTLFFDDIEDVIPRLEAKGFEVVDTDLTDPGWRETFVRPSVGFGTLLQIVDTNVDWMATSPYPLEDVLDGKIVWDGADLYRRDQD